MSYTIHSVHEVPPACFPLHRHPTSGVWSRPVPIPADGCHGIVPYTLPHLYTLCSSVGSEVVPSPQLCDSLIELSHSYRLVAVLHRFQQLDSLFQKRMPITPELIGQPYECFLNVTFQQQRRWAFYGAGIVTPTVPVPLPSDIPSSKVPAASAADNLSGKRTGLFRCRRFFP